MRRLLLRGMDALITNVPGYCVCVTTADCVPVLLYDKKQHVVAAVHAGWKGTVKHIVSHVMDHLNQNVRDARRRCDSLHRAEHFARII